MFYLDSCHVTKRIHRNILTTILDLQFSIQFRNLQNFLQTNWMKFRAHKWTSGRSELLLLRVSKPGGPQRVKWSTGFVLTLHIVNQTCVLCGFKIDDSMRSAKNGGLLYLDMGRPKWRHMPIAKLTLSFVLVHDEGDDSALRPVGAVHVLLQIAVRPDRHWHQDLVQIGALINLKH